MRKAVFTIISLILILLVGFGCTPPGENVRLHGNSHKLSSAKGAKDVSKKKVADEDSEAEEIEFDDGADEGPDMAVKSGMDGGAADLENEDFYQKGIASWYGREFHGKLTASGEKFNMNKYTAAHKTLPFGSVIEVTNLANGKTVKVTINDRGPYKGNRILDLSFMAAKKLDMIGKGKAMVGIAVLKKGKSVTDDSAENEINDVEPVSDDVSPYYKGGGLTLQVGAFYSKKHAEDLKKRVEDLTNYDARLFHDGDMYKVQIEGINSKKEVNHYKQILLDENIPSFLIKGQK